MAARFSAPVQTGPGAQSAVCTKATGGRSQRIKPSARGVDHPHLAARLKKEESYTCSGANFVFVCVFFYARTLLMFSFNFASVFQAIGWQADAEHTISFSIPLYRIIHNFLCVNNRRS